MEDGDTRKIKVEVNWSKELVTDQNGRGSKEKSEETTSYKGK